MFDKVTPIAADDGLETLINKGLIIYHHDRRPQRVFEFLLSKDYTISQADQLTNIIVRNYEEYMDLRKNALIKIFAGIFIAVLGIYVTWASLQSNTGFYVIFYGMIITGLGFLAKGYWDMPKKNIFKQEKI